VLETDPIVFRLLWRCFIGEWSNRNRNGSVGAEPDAGGIGDKFVRLEKHSLLAYLALLPGILKKTKKSSFPKKKKHSPNAHDYKQCGR